MFDNIKSADELYATENEKEYYDRKLLEYQDMYSIKQAITSYSKIKLFNIDQQQKLKYECYSKCYDNNQVIFENSEEGIKNLVNAQLSVKTNKRSQIISKNVDKLVYFKNQTCHSNCDQMINYNVDQTYQEKLVIKQIYIDVDGFVKISQIVDIENFGYNKETISLIDIPAKWQIELFNIIMIQLSLSLIIIFL